MNALDRYYAYKFIFLLTQDWQDTDAFKQGIIDKDGEQLKKRRELKTSEEKSAYTQFHQLVYRLKRMLSKVPMAQSTVGRFATAILLIREECGVHEAIDTAFLDHLKESNIELPPIVQLISEETVPGNDFPIVFGYWFEKNDDGDLELVNEMNMTTGVDMGVGSKSKSKPLKRDYSQWLKNLKKRRGEDGIAEEILGDDTFAGNAVFNCDSETFNKCRMGKTKYVRYSTFVGDDEIGENIRQYGRMYPDRGIVLRDALSGAMLYLRRGK